MKKHITVAVLIAVLAGVWNTGCNEDKKNDTSTTTTMRTTSFEGALGSCVNGGVKIEVLVDGTVDDAQTQYICNGNNGINGNDGQSGSDGVNGENGTNASIQTTPFEDAQGNCTNGGIKVEVLIDGEVQEDQTQYICNGDNGVDGNDGQDGQNGENGTNASVQTTTFTGEQGDCTNGGVKVEVLINGEVQKDQTQYICNGANGQDGQDGENGHSALVVTSDEVGDNCAHGGIRLDFGLDSNDNGTLDAEELLSSRYVCNGEKGADGENGKTANVQTTIFEDEQGGCTNGGIKVEVLFDGVVQADQTQYICNGANGQDGTDGQNGQNALVATSDADAAHCANGGIQVDTGLDSNNNGTLDADEIRTSSYVCNGTNGTDGTNITNASVDSESFDGEQNGCTNGGIKLTIHNEGQADQVQYICNGVDGKDGTNGTNTSMQTTPFTGVAGECTNGGVRIDILKDDEIQPDLTQYVCNGVNGQDGQNGQDGKVVTIQTMSFAGEQNGCKNGGIQIDVLLDGDVQPDQTKYICNGTDGQDGENGQDGVSTLVNTVPFTGKQENCENGGIRIEVGADSNHNAILDESEVSSTRYVCNGVNGENGQDGTTPTIVTSPFSGAQGTCEHGGIEIEITLNEATSKQYICNGADGQNGTDGQNGHNALVATSDDVGSHCGNGGIRVDTGLDSNNNGTLESDEIRSSSYICNGTDGTNGTNASVDSESFEGALNGCTNGGIKLTIHNEGQEDQTQIVCNGVAECLSDNGCRETAYCDLTTHTCIDKKSYNETCITDLECLSGVCRSSGFCSCEGEAYDELCLSGNSAIFGNYYQSDNVTKEPIEWLVLENDTENRKLLLLSKYVLDAQQYHHEPLITISWEDCSLRSWLNSTFLNNAFSASEQNMILTTHLENSDLYSLGGNDTDDKIFLLRDSDVHGESAYYSDGHWYFNNYADRVAYATQYTVVNRFFAYAFLDGGNTKCTSSNYKLNRCLALWWLRKEGDSDNFAPLVSNINNNDGIVEFEDITVLGVRPALWVQY